MGGKRGWHSCKSLEEVKGTAAKEIYRVCNHQKGREEGRA